jgi:hypothetical protein
VVTPDGTSWPRNATMFGDSSPTGQLIDDFCKHSWLPIA